MILKGTFRAWSALVVARLYRRRRLLHKVMQRWRSVMQTLRHDRRMWYLAVRHHHHTIVRRAGMARVVWLDATLTSCMLCCAMLCACAQVTKCFLAITRWRHTKLSLQRRRIRQRFAGVPQTTARSLSVLRSRRHDTVPAHGGHAGTARAAATVPTTSRRAPLNTSQASQRTCGAHRRSWLRLPHRVFTPACCGCCWSAHLGRKSTRRATSNIGAETTAAARADELRDAVRVVHSGRAAARAVWASPRASRPRPQPLSQAAYTAAQTTAAHDAERTSSHVPPLSPRAMESDTAAEMAAAAAKQPSTLPLSRAGHDHGSYHEHDYGHDDTGSHRPVALFVRQPVGPPATAPPPTEVASPPPPPRPRLPLPFPIAQADREADPRYSRRRARGQRLVQEMQSLPPGARRVRGSAALYMTGK